MYESIGYETYSESSIQNGKEGQLPASGLLKEVPYGYEDFLQGMN
jgi:hypothetical protein